MHGLVKRQAHRVLVLALAALVPAAAAAGCTSSGGANAPSANTKTTVLSLQQIDCSSCGTDLARVLVAQDGVKKTAFDKHTAELTVVADASVDVLALAQHHKPKNEAYSLVEGSGQGRYVAWKEGPAGADMKVVAKGGEDVPDLAPHLAADKVTIVDFSADWCRPCRTLDAHVVEVLAKRKDVAYRKLDVGDWDTPLGKRWLVGVEKLPYVIVFDKRGRKVDAISGVDLERLDAAVEKGAGASAPTEKAP
jgi:thiol-disulfide isomerase/thioredoxin